jgi:aspartyl-tRNA(Asn)/glutamyl-tRNA(Gln) amidotransferase subunit A
MTDLTHLTIADALDGLAAKKFSARELTDAHLRKMAALKKLNAYITETPERALAQAEASDKRRAAGGKVGALDGIPLGIKDLFCTKGVRTTAARTSSKATSCRLMNPPSPRICGMPAR